MASEWDRGILAKSSWHGLEDVGIMADAVEMVLAGERTGAWPVSLRDEDICTVGGLTAPGRAVVGSYSQHPDRVLGVVGSSYRATPPSEWRSLISAACDAGARPTGAFSLRDGARVLATLEVGLANGLRTNLLLADAYNGTMPFTCGFTTIDVVCANTLAISLRKDGAGMAGIRHTASAEAKIEALRRTIGDAIASGESVRELHKAATETRLDRATATKIFDALFPEATTDSGRAKTIADNARDEARAAMALPINHRGQPGSLATLWNTATWLVDREVNGSARTTRGAADPLESMLFGSRAKRVEEIQTIIEVVMRDGSVQQVHATEALEMGVDAREVGRNVLEDMLS